MRKVEEFRQHAEECRLLAKRSISENDRKMLHNMADAWESLAVDRETDLARLKRLKSIDHGVRSGGDDT